MSLLEEIQNEAVDSKSDLGSLLRKCKLLAARLGSQPLEDWIIWESNGYPDGITVPDYRIWPLTIKGHFSGPFGSGIKNAEIPLASLPENIRESFHNYECRQSIASMEQMLKGSDHSTLRVGTGDLAIVLGTNVFQGQSCMQTWSEFGTGNVFELFNKVRNLILDLSLAVWKEEPTAGESTITSSSSIKPSRVTQIFNTTVYGGSANLLGAANSSLVSFNVQQNNIPSLENALRENDVPQEDIDCLKAALEEDERPVEQDKFGPKVSSWIAGMVKKAAEGGWAVSIGTAGGLLAQVISKFYGL